MQRAVRWAYAHSMSGVDLRFELERAITENELVLHFQPRVSLATLELRGVEALVRWRHPTRGIIPPSEFIAAAERAGLIRDLDTWVIRQTLLQAAVWQKDGVAIGVSVNVGAAMLRDEPFLRLFERTLKMQGDPGKLTLEVSATSLAGGDWPAEGLARLRQGGVKLALDDVTAPAELEAASGARWDFVKLGRRLVTGAARDPRTGATLRALVARANELGGRVIGVGAEDQSALTLLRDAGAEMVQGYVVAPPLGVQELFAWSRAQPKPV